MSKNVLDYLSKRCFLSVYFGFVWHLSVEVPDCLSKCLFSSFISEESKSICDFKSEISCFALAKASLIGSMVFRLASKF